MSEVADDSFVTEPVSQETIPPISSAEVSLRAHAMKYVRAFMIGFFVMQFMAIELPSIYEGGLDFQLIQDNAVSLSLDYLMFVVPIGLAVYIIGRVILLLARQRGFSGNRSLFIDFVLSAALMVTLFVNLGVYLDWTSAFMASPIFDIPIYSLFESAIVIASMFFLALGLVYRFMSRLNQSFTTNRAFGLVYLRESGRMVGSKSATRCWPAFRGDGYKFGFHNKWR